MTDFSESERQFLAPHYRRINARRMEHLASLNLPIADRTVLELGAGIGELSTFFLDRGCTVTSIEGRAENIEIHNRDLEILKPAVNWAGRPKLMQADLNHPGKVRVDACDIVFCYGLLYHLSNPVDFLEWLPTKCRQILILETVVTFDDESVVRRVTEAPNPTQALQGDAVRPSRRFVFESIAKNFEYSYMPTTQPAHEQFPLTWRGEIANKASFARSIFIGSREPIENPLLGATIPSAQTRSA